ncbi:MAG: choice-of-anchor D domain-containing protein [Ignavibacteria bacterium]|nr:choice-of-anchor D domain-containing protein [Ignavibacteria bacterium]
MKKFFLLISLTGFLLFLTHYSSISDSPRLVLIEEATNTSCGPCAAQNPTFQRFINNNFSVVIPLIYHAWWPGNNDPMYLENTTMNTARIKYYGIDQQGVPNVRVNGLTATPTGNWYAGAAGDTLAIKNEVDKYRGTNSPITLTVAENRSGTQSTVQVNISTTQSLVGKKLRVAVVEYYISYASAPGTNGEKEFYWVARNMLPDANGTTLDIQAGSNKSYTFNYSIKSSWKASQIYIVAFIQDDQTKEVLQAAQNLKVAKVNVEAQNPFITIPRKGQLEYSFNVTNPSNELLRVNVALNTTNSYIPSGWTATPSTNQLILQPNQSQQLKVTVKSGTKAEFAIVGIDFTPNVQTPYEINTGYFYVLTEDTKYAFYALSNSPSPTFAYQGILTQAKYANDAALLPFALEVINNYPVSNFDLAMFGFSYWVRGVLGGYYVESSPLFASLNSMISAGKSILLTSEVDLAFSYGQQGSATARDFYTNKLYINKAQEPVLRVSVNTQGQITAVNSYPATGVSGDPIGNGINLTMNQYNQNTHPYFIVYTDIIGITNPNFTKPIIYYDNNQSAIGGVRVDNGKSRIVYLSSGFEAIADATRRNGFIGKILDWLLSKPGTKIGPQIALSTSSIDFEEVVVGTTASKTFDLTNTGDEPLVISQLYVDRDFDPENVFNIKNPPTLPLTLQPNQKYTVEVTFSPKQEAVSYTTSIVIKSNAKNSPDELVTLDGIGVAGNVPIISSNKSEINFGSVTVQSTKVGDVDITNTGLADLQITNIQIVNNLNAFSIMNKPTLPYTLGPGETITISILFSPTEAKIYNSILRITSNANNEPTLNIPLLGKGEVSGSVSETTFSNGTIVKISPLPVGNELNINIETQETLNATAIIQLFDLQGNLILNLPSITIKQGSQKEKFSFVNLPNGHYNLRIQIGDEVQVVPIVVVK